MTLQTPVAEPPRMLDVAAVAAMLGLSIRTVYRLTDAGEMPNPIKLGGSNRWDRLTVEKWIDAGCPPVTSLEVPQ